MQNENETRLGLVICLTNVPTQFRGYFLLSLWKIYFAHSLDKQNVAHTKSIFITAQQNAIWLVDHVSTKYFNYWVCGCGMA